MVVVESAYTDYATRAGKIQGIRSAVPDYTFQAEMPATTSAIDADFANPPASGDNDTRFDLQWGSQAIDVAGAWNQGYRGAGATVAVLDSGVSCSHPDIAPNLLLAQSTSFIAGEGVCHPFNGAFNHGTHVAGIIAAPDNGIGTIGVAPQAKILAVKVLSDTGSGNFGAIIQGIVYAADHGADVINMSLGVHGGLKVNGQGANQVRELVNATKRAVMYARARNALTIVSAGNDAQDLDHSSGVKICDSDGSCVVANLVSFPAELPGALSISATAPIGWAKAPTTTFLDNLASYSNYGASAISLAGPGGDAAYPGSENCTRAGITNPCWVFDLVFAPGGYAIVGWPAVRVLHLGRGHQHGRAARERRRRADHRQAWRHDGACRRSSASCVHPPTTSASRATTPRMAPAGSTQRTPCALISSRVCNGRPSGRPFFLARARITA